MLFFLNRTFFVTYVFLVTLCLLIFFNLLFFITFFVSYSRVFCCVPALFLLQIYFFCVACSRFYICKFIFSVSLALAFYICKFIFSVSLALAFYSVLSSFFYFFCIIRFFIFLLWCACSCLFLHPLVRASFFSARATRLLA